MLKYLLALQAAARAVPELFAAAGVAAADVHADARGERRAALARGVFAAMAASPEVMPDHAPADVDMASSQCFLTCVLQLAPAVPVHSWLHSCRQAVSMRRHHRPQRDWSWPVPQCNPFWTLNKWRLCRQWRSKLVLVVRGLGDVLARRSRGDGAADAGVRGPRRRQREAALAALAVAAADGAAVRGACPHADLPACTCARPSPRACCVWTLARQ